MLMLWWYFECRMCVTYVFFCLHRLLLFDFSFHVTVVSENAHVCTFETVLEDTACIWLRIRNASMPMEKTAWWWLSTVSIELIRKRAKHKYKHTEKPQKPSSDTKWEHEREQEGEKGKKTQNRNTNKRSAPTCSAHPYYIFNNWIMLHSEDDDNNVFMCFSFSRSLSHSLTVRFKLTFQTLKYFRTLPSVPMSYSLSHLNEWMNE